MSEIACENCGHSTFVLMEEVTRKWRGLQIDEVSKTIVADVATDEIDWDSGSDAMLQCVDCDETFHLPDGYRLEFA